MIEMTFLYSYEAHDNGLLEDNTGREFHLVEVSRLYASN